jgi:phosphoribosyl-dephospho-CoA transferase
MNDVNIINSNPSRHTLVWIRPECRAAVAGQIRDDAMHAHVAAWLAADRPLVVARQPVADVGAGHAREQKDNRGHGPLLQLKPCSIENGISDSIVVGLALPPAQGKRRIAFNVASHDIARYTPPLRLADALVHAPSEWQPALAELDAAATNIDIELRVFGSLAWQALSGMQYLTPQSDIDLLWHPRSHAQLQQGVALLARWEQDHGLRADGEVLFGGSSAVSWREWATLKSGDDQRVLVKRASSAELVAAGELLELLA